MADLIPFRIHFDSDDAAPYDTVATDALEARRRAKAARPNEIIRKVKVVREKEDV